VLCDKDFGDRPGRALAVVLHAVAGAMLLLAGILCEFLSSAAGSRRDARLTLAQFGLDFNPLRMILFYRRESYSTVPHTSMQQRCAVR
jgi:hypothetical protein